ncbi:MAG: outer membrane protein transport protein [Candidatus Marinimicrobia bacterium]|nr:outer membrane protein transport protein [Candidatus Neomarinimicrobiota bacterium]
MRSVMFVFLILVLAMGIAMAGGIVTNTNQSAAYMRTLNRNASTDVDAVYFNPAGLTRLEDGLHLSLSNQSIFQTKTVTNNYQFLNTDEFVGDVKALLFPNFYLAYKTGKLAFSAGFEPIGGGGSANFEKGLPSFELPVSDLVPGLADHGVTAYDIDVAFEGSSIYYGFQAGISYKVNDMVSIGLGGRYVSAKNSYIGHLKNAGIILGGSLIPATDFFTGAAAGATVNANLYADTSAYFYDLATNFTGIDSLTYVGYGDAYKAGSDQYLAGAAEATAKSTLLADQEVDVTQKATGITPIISVFLTPFDGLDIAFRYEGLTKLELVNEADDDKQALVGYEVDGTKIYQFPDGGKTSADMPAMMALGISYKVSDALRTEFDFNYYMNSGVNWDGREDNVENGYEVGVAVEYCLNDKLKASVGFLNADGGAKPAYQTDLSYSLKSNTIGLGVAYAVSPNLIVNVGGLNTFYQEDEREGQHDLGGSGTLIDYAEKYMKTTFGFAIGVDYKF